MSDLEYPDSCPPRGTNAAFDAGWNAHRVGISRKTVVVLSPDPEWAALGYDVRDLIDSRQSALTTTERPGDDSSSEGSAT